eukprot:SAG25_NODE_564_length_6902_cov_5.254741_7_plen_72_part_00
MFSHTHTCEVTDGPQPVRLSCDGPTTATTDDDPNYSLTTTLNDSMLVVVQVAGHPLLRAADVSARRRRAQA